MPEGTPSVLRGRRLLIGVTGGIAAYKVPFLIRGLITRGVGVRVAMTRNAVHFVTPLTLETLSGSPVRTQMFDGRSGSTMAHIEWSREADLMLIAPATANFIGKMANGIADDLLSTMVLTVESPLCVVPSMNSRMYRHPAVVRNIQLLRDRGVHIVEPGSGDLACGEKGPGRMAETDEILARVEDLLKPLGRLSGKRILVTAGPTVEAIDPVRSICNRSSGKTGYALAREASRMGGSVTLVSGPTALDPPAGVTFVPVQTALEMQEKVRDLFGATDVLIMAAAVGDFRAAAPRSEKIKRASGEMTLDLVANPDILKEISRERTTQILVGFAAETGNPEKEARKKLHEKGVDVIVANDVSDKALGFGSDENRVVILDRKGGREDTGILPKREIARKILERLCKDFF